VAKCKAIPVQLPILLSAKPSSTKLQIKRQIFVGAHHLAEEMLFNEEEEETVNQLQVSRFE